MFTLPDLPYAYNALEPYIDERTMQIHHDKHHGAYVKNLNDALSGHADFLTMTIEDLVRNLAKVPEQLRTKVRNNGGGHTNHSLFWQVMAPRQDSHQKGFDGELSRTDSGQAPQPSGEVARAIDAAFGNFAQFQEKFTAAGLGRFGSGWVWLILDGGKLAIVDTPNQDTPLMEGKTPILGLDVWEHAYYLKYQNLRGEYIKNWWQVVNWQEVERRYRELSHGIF